MQALEPFCLLSSPGAVSGEWDYALHLVQMVAFLGLLGAGAYFLTDYTRKRKIRSALANEGKIVVADTCSLGSRQFLVVAQYGAEKHLIGVSPGSISYLSRLSGAEGDFQVKLEQASSGQEEGG